MNPGAGAPRRASASAGSFTRRPALAVAVPFITGILLHPVLPHLPLLWLPLIAGLTLAAIVIFPYGRTCSACIALALLLSGACIAQIEAFYYPHDHISAFAEDEPRLAHLELIIESPPRTLHSALGQHAPLPPRQVTTATLTAVRTWDGWQSARGRVLLTIAQPHPTLAAGQRVRVFGMLQRPAPAMNPGQFHWERYYREKRVLCSMRVAQAANVEVLQKTGFQPLHLLRQRVRQTLAAGFTHHNSLDHALLRAILVGDRDPEMRDVQEQFRRTGTSHHLAISGLHVGILGMLVYGTCRLIRCSPRTSAWVLVCFVIVYGMIALPSPPVVRSVLLCAAFGIGVLQRRRADPVQLLALSVLVMLIYKPLDLYSAGFQLSFGTVLALMTLTRPLAHWIDPPPEDPPPLEPPAMAQQIRHTLRQRGVQVLAAAFVAWAASLPLVGWHFERLNPWAIPGSILLAPVVFLALTGGMLKVLLTLLLPSLAGGWAAAAAQPMALMRFIVDLLDRLPMSDLPLGKPPLALVLAYYAFILLPLVPWVRREGLRRAVRLAPPAACALAVAMPFLLGLGPRAPMRESLRATLLAVGAGQCLVIEVPRRGVILIDAGSTSLADLVRSCAGPYLRHRRIRRIEAIYLTHPHYDHFSGVSELREMYGSPGIVVSPLFRGGASGNPAAEILLRSMDDSDHPPEILPAGRRVQLGPQTELEILWPAGYAHPIDPDNDSLVLRLTHAGRSILIPGDIMEIAKRRLLDNPDQLRADVLIAPHHGSSEAATADFLAAVNPQVILSSNSRRLSMKQRDFDEIAADRPLYRTHRSGALEILITPDGTIIVTPFVKTPDARPIILAY
jgi:competence protein ComEC